MKGLDFWIPILILGICSNAVSSGVASILAWLKLSLSTELTLWLGGCSALLLLTFALWVTPGVVWAIGLVTNLWAHDHE